jgi:hypothetical protein
MIQRTETPTQMLVALNHRMQTHGRQLRQTCTECVEPSWSEVAATVHRKCQTRPSSHQPCATHPPFLDNLHFDDFVKSVNLKSRMCELFVRFGIVRTCASQASTCTMLVTFGLPVWFFGFCFRFVKSTVGDRRLWPVELRESWLMWPMTMRKTLKVANMDKAQWTRLLECSRTLRTKRSPVTHHRQFSGMRLSVVTTLCSPNEDVGRMNKRYNADFRPSFQRFVAQIDDSLFSDTTIFCDNFMLPQTKMLEGSDEHNRNLSERVFEALFNAL